MDTNSIDVDGTRYAITEEPNDDGATTRTTIDMSRPDVRALVIDTEQPDDAYSIEITASLHAHDLRKRGYYTRATAPDAGLARMTRRTYTALTGDAAATLNEVIGAHYDAPTGIATYTIACWHTSDTLENSIRDNRAIIDAFLAALNTLAND